MARQEANEQFQLTSFLDGANAAYIEQLYARYETDPSSVSAEWQSFFKALADQPEDVVKAAKGASWKKPNWPIVANGELVSALDGDWGTVEKVIEKKVKAKAEEAAAVTGAARERGRYPSGDARFRSRHHDDPRLSCAWPPARQARPARPCRPGR